MKIIDHGMWHVYKPNKLPEAAPPGAMFTRRAGDGIDWYDYVNSGRHFTEGSVKMTVIDGIVGAATSDPTALWPGNARVLEVSGVETDDPQKLFGDKVYDPEKKTFKARTLPETIDIKDLLKRLEALENKKGQD